MKSSNGSVKLLWPLPTVREVGADIKLALKNSVQSTQFIRFIDKVEKDIKTVVQTIVKREDEQEFARLNGKNAMFVEDALRVIKKSLESFEEIESFEIKTHHFESLHDHDAVGFITSNKDWSAKPQEGL